MYTVIQMLPSTEVVLHEFVENQEQIGAGVRQDGLSHGFYI